MMTKGRVIFGLVVVLAAAGGAARWGLFGDPDELAKWFPPLTWFSGDGKGAQSQQAGPRAVAVEVATAVRKKTPVLLEALATSPRWQASP
jgi:hypothetical protein